MAYDNGPWDGDGITSSSAAAHAGDSHKTALGYAKASEALISSVGGLSVSGSDIVVRYTWFADCNLDGTVDLTDATFLYANYNAYTQKWLYGDVNYDGHVDLTDFTLLAQNFNQSGYPT